LLSQQLKGDHTLAELSTQFDLHQNQIIDWENQLLEQSISIFHDQQHNKNLRLT